MRDRPVASRPTWLARLATTGNRRLIHGAESLFGKRKVVQELRRGQRFQGIVQAIGSEGCFVDIGAERPGFVHRSRIRGFVRDINELLHVGQEVTVWVKEVKSQGQIALSMERRWATSPDLADFALIPKSRWLTGTVRSLMEGGDITVSVAPSDQAIPAVGVVPVQRIPPSTPVKVGKEVQVRILKIDIYDKSLILTMMEDSEEGTLSADLSGFNMVPSHQWLNAVVVAVFPTSASVMVEAPVHGPDAPAVIRASCIPDLEDSDLEIGDVLEVGQTIFVRLLHVNPYLSGSVKVTMYPPELEL